MPEISTCECRHSDAWGVESYLELTDQGLEAKTTPSDALVGNALFGALAFAEITLMFGKFYGFDFAGLDDAIKAAINEGFRP